MRKTSGLLLVLILAFGVAGQAGAKTMTWHGTTMLKLGAYPPDGMVLDPGSGVATVNNSSGGPHMSTLRIVGDGVPDSGVWVVTDPNTTPQIKSIRVTGTMRSATMTGISGATHGGPHELAMGGFTRVCLFLPGCITNIAMANTKNSGNTGIGVGGVITMGGLGSIRISVEGAPWEIHTVTQINQTVKGNFVTLARAGWVHGAASATDSSTAATSGVINFVQAATVKTSGITGNSQTLSLFIDLRLHFIPEPGLLLLLGSGVVGLGLLGRSRLKK